MRPRFVAVLLLVLACMVPPLQAQDEPSFFIESIEVTGTSSSAGRIVIAESRLSEGRTYGEPELRDAVSRIRRLPFVVWTDFRLGKGTAPGAYVLIINIRPMKPLFLNARMSTSWEIDERRGLTPLDPVTEFIAQRQTSEVTAGGRMFVGAKGMLNVAAQHVEHRNDRFTVAFTQYDLFGTRASLTGLVSYLDDPGAMRSNTPGERFDWHFRDNLTWSLIGVVPTGPNDSIRFLWQRGERPIRYLELRPEGHRRVLRSLPQIRKELFWIHDTTNDPLFPTSGTRLTFGIARTSTPTSGLTLLGRVKTDEYLVTLERSWSLTPSQALTVGGSGTDHDRSIREYRPFVRWSIDLWGRERTLALGDLRLEIEGDREYTRIQEGHFFAESILRAGLVQRNVWGTLRLDFAYRGWREPHQR